MHREKNSKSEIRIRKLFRFAPACQPDNRISLFGAERQVPIAMALSGGPIREIRGK
jgi:hypothetical protein